MHQSEDISRDALEEMVIATLMQDQAAAGDILAELTEKDFSHPAWQGLMLAAKRLHNEGLPIIEGTLVAYYGKEGELFSAYAERASTIRTPSDHHWLIDQLRRKSMLDSIKAAAERLTVVDDLEEAAAIVSKINELSSARRGVKITRLGDAVQAYYDSIGKEKPEFIRTGLRIFDDEVLLRRGKLFVVGGYPSSGKTLLTLQMAQQMGGKNKVGYFSFETDDQDVATRAISYRSGINNKKIVLQDLTKAEQEQVRKVSKITQRLDVDIIQASGMTGGDIRAITLARKYDVVFVDYLQLVESTNRRASNYERASEASRALQGLSRTGNCLVVALSQLSRPETRKDGKLIPPTMSSLRESGQIEQDADVIALLYHEDMDDNTSNRIFRVAKNKGGEWLDLLMAFSGAAQRLEVIDRRHKAQAYPIPEGRGPEPPDDWKSAPRAF